MKAVASAPGKVFLIGEYAVLAGGSALLLAVNRRASVCIQPCLSPGVRTNADQKRTIEETPLLVSAIEGLERLGLFDRQVLEGHEVVLDTSAFYAGSVKLGLGSSAALMVAVLKALHYSGNCSHSDLLDLAIRCHAAFQGGLGSGADVATSVMGGCIRFARGSAPAALAMPPDLHLLLVWTGEAASTTTYVRKFNHWCKHAPAVSQQHLNNLSRLSSEAISDFKNRQTESFIDKVSQFDRQLVSLSEDAGLESYTRAHQTLRGLVEKSKCAYKPSGAGGGDFGIAYSTDAGNIRELNEALSKKGYLTLPADDRVPASECVSRSNDG